MPSKLFSLVFLLPALVKAANDWNTPCHDGSCSFHVSNSDTNATIASVFLNGSTSALSDLSPAAGWSLFDYDPSVPLANQVVRAICTGSNSTCSHLYKNGANHTIVRLPPGGASAFARVVDEWVHENQTVPQDVKQKLSRRDGEPDSFVRGLILDDDFTAANISHHGPISMHILASTGHDATGVSSRGLSRRDLLDHLKSIGAGVVNSVKAFNTAAGKELNHIEHAEHQTRTVLSSVARDSPPPPPPNKKPEHWTSSASDSWNVDEQQSMFPDDSCALNVHAITEGNYSYSFVLSGSTDNSTGTPVFTLDPDAFSMDFGFDVDITSNSTIQSSGVLSGSSSYVVSRNSYPGLNIAHLLSINPIFQVTVEADAADLNAISDMELDLAYSIQGGKLSIPGNIAAEPPAPQNITVQVSVDHDQNLSGVLEVHVIPSFIFDFALFNQASNIQLNLDASTILAFGFRSCFDVEGGLNIDASGTYPSSEETASTFESPSLSKKWDISPTKCVNIQTRREHPKDIAISKRKPVSRASVDAICPAPNPDFIDLV